MPQVRYGVEDTLRLFLPRAVRPVESRQGEMLEDMSKIYDNEVNRKFEDGVKGILCAAGVKRADFCVGYFNLRGWRTVADDVATLAGAPVRENNRQGGRDHWEEVSRKCRLLIGMYRPIPELVREMYEIAKTTVDVDKVQRWKRMIVADFRRQLTLGVPTAEDEKTLRKLRNQLADGHVAVKLYLRNPLHAKLYLAYRPGDPTPVLSLMGSSNLTFGGMTRNGELNAEFADVADTDVYARWFDTRWNDLYSVDITQELINAIDEGWPSEIGYTPYEIYLKIMYNLSREARNGVNEYHLPAPFDKELFEFQQTAVKLAVRHLEKRGGAMIGDVVGLGKTITACAVAKFYEETLGASTIVLCPANLREMWEGYKKHYDLKMTVMSIDERKFDPRKMQYFPLAIIDESQNLRNAERQRYARIKDLLNYQHNKVLLLTATPYNKDYEDLAAQLRLFVDPEVDLGIRPEEAIRRFGGEHEFATNFPNTLISSLGAFEKSECADDWRDLMKLYLVRRTRTFIKNNYAKKDADGYYLEFQDGAKNYFPDRVPKSLKFPTTPGDQFSLLYSNKMVSLIDALKLPRYGLQKYIDEEATKDLPKHEQQVIDNLSRAGKRLMGFCSSNFYKRMDSSGVSFLMSIYRYAVRNARDLYALKNGLDLPIRADTDLGSGYVEKEDGSGAVQFSFPTDIKEYEKAGKAAYEKLVAEAGKSVEWLSPKYFKKSLVTDIKKDINKVIEMLTLCGVWKPELDEKLNMLEDLLTRKHGKDKVLVFSQFSDTARYVAEQLKARGLVNVVEVDGDAEDVTLQTMKFSPVSNHAPVAIPEKDQTRVLVATDMLSEGQNLQDAHVVVNFDLPWAIIRLIQRAGRVDRIGQKAKKVFCYSFFPQEGIEDIINLRGRLNQRLNQNAGVVGSDEVFFEGNVTNIRDLFNEKSGILDDDGDDGEVDLSSQAYQIWETATKDDKKLAERIKGLADAIYSTKDKEKLSAGVLTYAKTASDSDVLVWIGSDKKVVSTSPLKIFKALACSAQTPILPPLENHHELVREALQKVRSSGTAVAMGVLGSKSSVKYKIFAMVENRLKEDLMPLFEQGLKEVSDELYNYPIKEAARSMLGKMIQQRRSSDDIIEAVLELHKDNELCIVPDENSCTVREPRVICSMGLS